LLGGKQVSGALGFCHWRGFTGQSKNLQGNCENQLDENGGFDSTGGEIGSERRKVKKTRRGKMKKTRIATSLRAVGRPTKREGICFGTKTRSMLKGR